jgi:hypothetical protein
LAINKLRYYLGPLGSLQALPPMVGGAVFPEAPIHIPGTLHTSLSGRTTLDRVGRPRRSWPMVWENLKETDRLPIDAAILNATGQPLRLIDPRSSNRLPADVSAGGSLTASTGGFTSSYAVLDTATRSVSNGRGTCDTGHAWTTTGGSASDYSVTGTKLQDSVGTVNVSRYGTILSGLGDFDITIEFATNALAAGASQLAHALGRFVDTSNYYMARADLTTTAAITFSIQKRVAGVETSLKSVASGLTHIANTTYSIRFQGIGTTLRAKVWTGSTQPASWALTAVDTAFTSGGVGTRSVLLTGNTNTLPVLFSYDNIAIVGTPALAYLAGSVPAGYGGIIGGGQNWTGLFLNNLLTATSEKVPVLAGSTYTFSVFALGTTNVKLVARPFDASGVEQTLAASSSQTLTGSYQRFSWVWTPSAGQVSAWFGLQAQGSGNVQTTLWQTVIDDAVTPIVWGFGVGCPTVVLDPEVPASYWRAKFHRLRLLLREV